MSIKDTLLSQLYDVSISIGPEHREFSDKPEDYEWAADEMVYKATIFKGDSKNPEAPGNEYGVGYGDNEDDALNQAMLNKTVY